MGKSVKLMNISVSPGPVLVSDCRILSSCPDGIIVEVDCRTKYFTLETWAGSDDHPFVELGADRQTVGIDQRYAGRLTRVSFAELSVDEWSMVAASLGGRYTLTVAFVRRSKL